MATYVDYTPDSEITRAMFNFDIYGWSNYRLTGTVRVSTSDAFSLADYEGTNYSDFYSALYTPFENEIPWSNQMVDNLFDIFGIYSEFVNIPFQWSGDYDSNGSDTTANPEDVGRANVADINITWLARDDVSFSGIAGAYTDEFFNYSGGAGDIFLNAWTPDFDQDFSLDQNTYARQTLRTL